MEEKKVFFGQGNVRLEGLYANSGGAAGAVISHPHSLMGGNMGNSIVETLAETLKETCFRRSSFHRRSRFFVLTFGHCGATWG